MFGLRTWSVLSEIVPSLQFPMRAVFLWNGTFAFRSHAINVRYIVHPSGLLPEDMRENFRFFSSCKSRLYFVTGFRKTPHGPRLHVTRPVTTCAAQRGYVHSDTLVSSNESVSVGLAMLRTLEESTKLWDFAVLREPIVAQF